MGTKRLGTALRQRHNFLLRVFKKWGARVLDSSIVANAKTEGRFLGDGSVGKCYKIQSSDGTALCVKILKIQTLI